MGENRASYYRRIDASVTDEYQICDRIFKAIVPVVTVAVEISPNIARLFDTDGFFWTTHDSFLQLIAACRETGPRYKSLWLSLELIQFATKLFDPVICHRLVPPLCWSCRALSASLSMSHRHHPLSSSASQVRSLDPETHRNSGHSRTAVQGQEQTFDDRSKSTLLNKQNARFRFSLVADVAHLDWQHERSVNRKSLHTNATASATETASSSIGLVVIARPPMRS
jgi:hypothetical protein